MLFYRFRVSSNLTGYVEIGPSRYEASEEFVLTEYAARKWVSKLDVQSGKITFVCEIGGEERQFNDWNTSRHYSSKAKQDGAMPPIDYEVYTLPVLLNTVVPLLSNVDWGKPGWMPSSAELAVPLKRQSATPASMCTNLPAQVTDGLFFMFKDPLRDLMCNKFFRPASSARPSGSPRRPGVSPCVAATD